MDNSIYKTAQDHFEFLLRNYKEGLTLKEVEKLAFEVVTTMTENGSITTPGDAIEKIAEYREKGLDELKIIEKALEFSPVIKTAETTKAPELGLLSDSPSGEGQDNLTSFLLADVYN